MLRFIADIWTLSHGDVVVKSEPPEIEAIGGRAPMNALLLEFSIIPASIWI